MHSRDSYLHYPAQVQSHYTYLQGFVTQLLPSHSKYHPNKRKVNKMLPKATLTTATTSRLADVQNTSIEDTSSTDIAWLKENVQQLIDNQAVIKEQLNAQKHQSVKMPAIKKFNRNRLKL